MPKLFTIGHSNRTLQEFINLLQKYQISHIVDIRTVPKSRHVPWFNENELNASLHKEKIAYSHFADLGGLRHARKDSINQGWHNVSFRGFADYMQTPEFYAGLKKLNLLLKGKRKIAIMCAEAVPWRCHRSLIADAEVVRGIKVFNIMSLSSLKEHALTSFAIVNRKKKPIQIYYP